VVAEADGLLEIVRAVQSPWLGINLDTGNFKTKDPYGDLERCAPYAINVQFKVNIREQGQPQHGADFARLFDILRRANYQGHVALEYEAAEDPWATIPGLLKKMKQLMV
ncbi:MAG: sugar phosphate isomerase/epimerase family protein, partial [Limisphaerales bacterium]